MLVQHIDLIDEPSHLILQKVGVVVLVGGVRIEHYVLLSIVGVKEEMDYTDGKEN